MSASGDRTIAGGAKEARARLRTAEAYLHTAELVLEEASTQEFSNVAAGTAVLAGIAASDSICCSRLRKLHRGQDHSRGTHRVAREASAALRPHKLARREVPRRPRALCVHRMVRWCARVRRGRRHQAGPGHLRTALSTIRPAAGENAVHR